MTSAASSAKEAREMGLKRYFSGVPCRHGHVAERFVAHGQCSACNSQWDKANPEKRRARERKWRSNNREKVLGLKKKYRDENPEKAKASCKKYCAANKEKVREFKAAWRRANRDRHNSIQQKYCDAHREKIRASIRDYDRENPEVRKFINANRRARKRQAVGTHNREDVAIIREKQRDKCAYCGDKLKGRGHVDHIVALVNGGSNWPSNLQLTCVSCNLSKGAKDSVEFAQARGFSLSLETA